MTPDHPFAMLAAVVVASVAVVTDVRSRRIPNWLTASGLLVGLFGNLLLGGVADGASGALSSGLSALAGALLGFGLLFPLYLLRVTGAGHAIGAGDVKLVAALGAILGPHVVVSVAVYGAMVGGLQALFMLALRGRLGLFVTEALVMRVRPTLSGAKAPYAVPLAVGVFASIVLPPVLRF